jgi:hypothetical protein
MKTIIAMLLISSVCQAEIRNGYNHEMTYAEMSVNLYGKVLSDDKSDYATKQIAKEKIKQWRKIIAYHQLTDRLLEQFKLISPGIYQNINTIKDFNNHSVDVFVKFMDMSEMPASSQGATNVSAFDEHTYQSEYGIRTVSVKVAINAISLRTLAHEFGHVSYQVPHLSEYIKKYYSIYKQRRSVNGVTGHADNDVGGMRADEYVDLYQDQRRIYKSSGNGILSPEKLLQLIERQS